MKLTLCILSAPPPQWVVLGKNDVNNYSVFAIGNTQKGGLVIPANTVLAKVASSSQPIPIFGGSTGCLMELATADGIISYDFTPSSQPETPEPEDGTGQQEPETPAPGENQTPTPQGGGGGCRATNPAALLPALLIPLAALLRKRKEKERKRE